MVEVHTWGRQDNVDKNIAAQHRYREGELMARHIRVDSTCYDNARLDLTVRFSFYTTKYDNSYVFTLI